MLLKQGCCGGVDEAGVLFDFFLIFFWKTTVRHYTL